MAQTEFERGFIAGANAMKESALKMVLMATAQAPKGEQKELS